MKIKTNFSENNTIYTISINGDFNFSVLQEFRKSYKDNDLSSVRIIIDFRETSTIDSSALGMLLNLQNDLNKKDNEITIVNSNEVIRKILTITNFSNKFNIE